MKLQIQYYLKTSNKNYIFIVWTHVMRHLFYG